MYKSNYNFFFKINNKWFRYMLLLLIIFFFLFSSFIVLARENDSQNMDLVQAIQQDSMDSTLDLGDEPESGITTKIYRSTDNLNEALESVGTELEPELDADVINKEDLINMNSRLKKKIIHREALENEVDVKKSPDNIWLPWVLLAIILVLLTALIKVIKRVKI